MANQVRLLRKTQTAFTKLVLQCFISKLKSKPYSLLELFEVSELEILIKRKWSAVTDLMLAQLADREGRSSNTMQKAFSSLLLSSGTQLSFYSLGTYRHPAAWIGFRGCGQRKWQGGIQNYGEAAKGLALCQVPYKYLLAELIKIAVTGNNNNTGKKMEVHKVNVSQKVQTSQLSSCNQMPITRWGPAGIPHLLWDSMKHNHQGTAEKTQHLYPSALCELYADRWWD